MDHLYLIQKENQASGESDTVTNDAFDDGRIVANAPVPSPLDTQDDEDQQLAFMALADCYIVVQYGKKDEQLKIPVEKTIKGFQSLVIAIKNDDVFGVYPNNDEWLLELKPPTTHSKN